MDFTCVASPVWLYRKGPLYALLLLTPRVYSLADSGTTFIWANQEGSSIRTRRSYTHLGSTL